MKPPDEIIRDVCESHGLDPKCLRRETPHSARYARPRGEAARKLKETLGWSDSQIGDYFGGFHASTILKSRKPKYALRKRGRKPVTMEYLKIQLRELRNRVEWLEQRAMFPPPVPQERAGTNSPPPTATASHPDTPRGR